MSNYLKWCAIMVLALAPFFLIRCGVKDYKLFPTPTFSWSIPNPQRGDAMYVDPEPGFDRAWRRDEQVLVLLSSSSTELDPETVRVTISGVDGGSSATFNVTQTTGCEQSYCGNVTLDLSRPEMSAFRGTFGLAVVGMDKAGNTGTADAGIQVTRWKWAFQPSPNAIRTAPAVGSVGTVYVGTTGDGGTGSVVAVNPEGTMRWTANNGAIHAGLAVGASDGGDERVYIAARVGPDTNLYALEGRTGNSRFPGCTSRGSVEGPIVVTNSTPPGLGTVETALAFVNDGGTGSRLLAYRPGLGVASCWSDGGVGNVGTPEALGGLAANGPTIYFATDPTGPADGGFVWSYSASTTVDSWVFAWRTPSLTPDTRYHGLAVTPNQAVVSGTYSTGFGHLGTLPLDGGTQRYLDQRVDGPLWSPSVDNGSVYVGSSAGYLLVKGIDAGVVDYLSSVAGIARGAPLLGSNHHVYTADTGGRLVDFNIDTRQSWSLGTAGPIEGAPAIDCTRDSLGIAIAGRPGVLYLATTTGWLYAVVVDSAGIETDAPWPKHQHDPRNSGNAATRLSDFRCP